MDFIFRAGVSTAQQVTATSCTLVRASYGSSSKSPRRFTIASVFTTIRPSTCERSSRFGAGSFRSSTPSSPSSVKTPSARCSGVDRGVLHEVDKPKLAE